MPVKLVVAVTDRDWFEHLRSSPEIAEVNFWSPGTAVFRALEPGELFFFKLHAPDNFIAGFGVFVHSTPLPLPCSLAWEAFGEANGARSLAEMRTRVARHRHTPPDERTDFLIGCRILGPTFFFENSDWKEVPASWSRNIVSFKTYTTDDPEGMRLWEVAQPYLAGLPPIPPSIGASEGPAAPFHGRNELTSGWGQPTLVRPRLGQGAFRIVITDNYDRRCAVTGERTLPALDAAHIRPYASEGRHEPSNGLLLRRDIHSLFDLGYVTVTPAHHFEVSRRIRDEFENGRDYYALHGNSIRVPDRLDRRPDPGVLTWHNENRFLG
jgi:putative restriction endonuclease